MANAKRRQALRLADAQGWLCSLCDLPMDSFELTRDHIVPKSKGGRGILRNTAAAHETCNRHKGNGDSLSERYLLVRRRQYLRSVGIYASWPSSRVNKAALPNFGHDLEGRRLWAPQYGIT